MHDHIRSSDTKPQKYVPPIVGAKAHLTTHMHVYNSCVSDGCAHWLSKRLLLIGGRALLTCFLRRAQSVVGSLNYNSIKNSSTVLLGEAIKL